MIPKGFLPRLVVLLFAAVLAVSLAAEFIAVPWSVAGPSMQPTLWDGERVLVDVWSYRNRRPRIGEVVLVEGPDGTWLVKRMAALPAGTAAPDPRVWGESPAGRSLWLLGDNPASSADSRRFGAVPADRVRGRVVLRFWPPNRAGRVR